MAKNVYSLKKKKDTEEYHLFRATPTGQDTCNPEKRSICQKMELKDSIDKIFSCENEDSARKKCAAIGREVCGTCVSDLYETY